jgi:hypothetical protein
MPVAHEVEDKLVRTAAVSLMCRRGLLGCGIVLVTWLLHGIEVGWGCQDAALADCKLQPLLGTYKCWNGSCSGADWTLHGQCRSFYVLERKLHGADCT